MGEFLSQIDWDAMYVAIQETLLMTVISLVIAVILGFVLGNHPLYHKRRRTLSS